MRAIALQSGSSGNCIYVEAGDIRLLFDAGISGKKAKTRLAEHGVDISLVNGVLISHNHWDHIACAGIYHRKWGLPLYMTQGTFDATLKQRSLGNIQEVNHFPAGQSIDFGSVRVETVATPHDGVDGVCFVVEYGMKRVGVLTDLGHPFAELTNLMGTLDGVFLESNYDEKMLATGPYPRFLKNRITGPEGHLSNTEAAHLIKNSGQKLSWVCLSHLSGENNTPELALETSRDILGDNLDVSVASRQRAAQMLHI